MSFVCQVCGVDAVYSTRDPIRFWCFTHVPRVYQVDDGPYLLPSKVCRRNDPMSEIVLRMDVIAQLLGEIVNVLRDGGRVPSSDEAVEGNDGGTEKG